MANSQEWKIQNSGTTQELNSVFFTSASTGYVVGDLGTILKTSDGGIQWMAQNSGTPYYLLGVCFTDSLTG